MHLKKIILPAISLALTACSSSISSSANGSTRLVSNENYSCWQLESWGTNNKAAITRQACDWIDETFVWFRARNSDATFGDYWLHIPKSDPLVSISGQGWKYGLFIISENIVGTPPNDSVDFIRSGGPSPMTAGQEACPRPVQVQPGIGKAACRGEARATPPAGPQSFG